jgi:hypothetical protein
MASPEAAQDLHADDVQRDRQPARDARRARVGIDPPNGTPIDEPFFLASLAFLAGFSERFAKDVLDPSKLVSTAGQRAPTPVPGGVRAGPAA